MRRTVIALWIALLGCLLLSGCLRTDADLYVDASDRISGTLFLGVDPAMVPESQRGGLRDRIDEQIAGLSWPQGVQPRYAEQNGYVGAQLVFRDATLDDYAAAVKQAYDAAGIGGSTYPEFTRVKGQYDMRWRPSVHLAEQPTSVVPLAIGRASVAFPGPVTQTTGSVPRGNANSAVWPETSASDTPLLQASASAESNGALMKPFDTLIRGLIIISAMALAGLLLWIFLWKRSTRAAANK